MAGEDATRVHPSTIGDPAFLVKSGPLTPLDDFPNLSHQGGDMTRERLEGLPLSALLDLARKENLSDDPNIPRDELIEDLLEAFEEDRRERETLQNLILKIEQAKFASYAPQPAPAAFTQEPVLPGPYDDNSVDLVLRDPTWALGLWEVRKKDLDSWTQDPSFRGLTLRVVEYAGPGTPAITFFPIPVPQGAGSRYLHLPTPGRWYALELHATTDRESRMLAQSRMLQAPPELPDDPKDRPGLTPAQVRILEVSSSAFCETAKEPRDETSTGYPQRIGGWDEAAFQEDAE